MTDPLTKEDFAIDVGREPEGDELDRVNCAQAGEPGHRQCGWCFTCDCPRFMCQHLTSYMYEEGAQ